MPRLVAKAQNCNRIPLRIDERQIATGETPDAHHIKTITLENEVRGARGKMVTLAGRQDDDPWPDRHDSLARKLHFFNAPSASYRSLGRYCTVDFRFLLEIASIELAISRPNIPVCSPGTLDLRPRAE